MRIDEIFQSIYGHNNHSCHYASHVDGCCNVLGIIEAFDFDFTNGKSESKCNHLKYCLVTIENSKCDVTSFGITNVDEEV